MSAQHPKEQRAPVPKQDAATAAATATEATTAVAASDTADAAVATLDPNSHDERTKRLLEILPDETGLFQTMFYYPSYSATWDEPKEKERAVQETEALLIPQFTQAYVQREMEEMRRSAPPPPPVAASASSSRQSQPQQQQPQRSSNHGPPPKKKKKKKQKRQRRSYNDEDDDNDIDEEYFSYAYDEEQERADPHNQAQAVAQQMLQNEQATRQELQAKARVQLQPYLQFLHALPTCEPLTAGFLVLPVASHLKCCFCPCSSRLDGWRKQTVWKSQPPSSASSSAPPAGGDDENKQQQEQQQPQSFRSCGNSGRGATVFNASALVAHMETFNQGHGVTDWWHWIVLEYLKRVFAHYRGLNRRHKAFFPPGGREYTAIERLEYAKIGTHIRNLCESQQAQKQNVATLLQKKSQLEMVCERLANRLDQRRRSEMALRNLLATSWDEEAESSPSSSSSCKDKIKARRDKYFRLLRKSVQVKQLAKKTTLGLHLTIPQQDFQLQAILEDNEEEFLDDLSSRQDVANWLLPMNVQYEVNTEKRLKPSVKRDVTAVDRGGPTRQFLSEAFQSLDKLKAKCDKTQKETKLWHRDDNTGLFFPMEDETILHNLGLLKVGDDDQTNAMEKASLIVKPWARAIGRLIFYCMANKIAKDDEFQTTDQHLYVDASVLPEIYLYYLMADIEPTSSQYPLGDLIRFVSKHRMSKKEWNWKEDDDLERVKEGLHEYITTCFGDNTSTGQASSLPAQHELGGGALGTIHHLRGGLRKAAQMDFIDSRQLVLSGLLEGMSLDERLPDIDTQMAWGRAPVRYIRQMLLCMPSCSADNVIKCLKPKYADEHDPVYVQNQKKLLRIAEPTGETLGLLPQVLKDLCEDDPDAAGKFMLFATGRACTPYQDDAFRILIEFTFAHHKGEVTDDMLPWVHTCPMDVLLPGFAYHGSKELLREKLSQALEWCGHEFNME